MSDHKHSIGKIVRRWIAQPLRTLDQTATFADGQNWRCPDERCGVGVCGVRVPHPADSEREPNRCPVCLATAVLDTEHER